MLDSIQIIHNKVPNRLRIYVPAIRHRQTFAELLKQCLLKDPDIQGIYHAEPNIVTGTILLKFHPALHSEEQVIALVEKTVRAIVAGDVPIAAKHKNPRLGKMHPGAFFTRELLVSIGGNVIAGLLLAWLATR